MTTLASVWDFTHEETLTESQNTFQEYIDHVKPYLPSSSLFDRGDVEYEEEVQSLHKADIGFRRFLHRSMLRYLYGDWGDICDVDRKFNNSVVSGKRNENAVLTALYEYTLDEAANPAILYVTTELSGNPLTPNRTTVRLLDLRQKQRGKT